MKKTILHIAFDYPDCIDQNRTLAVKNLISSSKCFNHIVFSLNRHTKTLQYNLFKSQDNIYVISFFMLPYGIFLRTFLKRASDYMVKIIKSEGLRIDVIHAHKMTIEGIIAYYLSKELKLPYVLTIRGKTDTQVIKFKWRYRSLYKSLLHCSRCNFVLAPWAIGVIKRLMYRDNSVEEGFDWVVLPNFLKVMQFSIKQGSSHLNKFVMVFNFKDYKNKNILGVLRAIHYLKKYGTIVYLDVIGGGDVKDNNWIEKQIKKLNISSNVNLLGHVNNDDLFEILPTYCGLVNPSFRETFGYIYLEALSCRLPIIFSKETGIDGYFEDFNIAIKVNPKNYKSIANGMNRLLNNTSFYRNEISRMFKEKYLLQFTKNIVSSKYEYYLERTCFQKNELKTIN